MTDGNITYHVKELLEQINSKLDRLSGKMDTDIGRVETRLTQIEQEGFKRRIEKIEENQTWFGRALILAFIGFLVEGAIIALKVAA